MLSRPWRRLRDKFWALPLLFAAAAVLLGLGLTALDDWLDTSLSIPFLFAGGPEGARAVLSAIITSMISFTGLVFSITVVVLQLTSSQFSPRVLRTFLRDWVNQLALGVFVATFVYALVVLRSVRGTAQTDTFVPQVAVTVAFGFVLASVVVFLVYIDHIAQSIRAASIVTRIADETREVLESRHPADAERHAPLRPPGTRGRRLAADGPGVVQQVDDTALLRLAEEHDVTICLLRAVGEFVPAGAPLLEVHGEGVPADSELLSAVHLGKERSLDEDVGFGLRQLVDIAERALSPGINDPTTAVQVVDQLHDLLRRLVTRPLLPRQRLGETGRLAVHVPQPDLADLVDLAVDEISEFGAGVDRVMRRLGVMLEDLRSAAVPEHAGAVDAALAAFSTRYPVQGLEGWAEPTDTGLR
ncbi:hypothetical protein GCM10011376_29590 [Nocardioides flavus (ex Wang et al. 2016)]|uniref:DUF2254 domain-containing protein n=1 Tax=Nocardioides flavus (ex Wang et al. 2016) TaxID=2058780 RepID=A0ABQ3HQA0_9ACTN|nr:DUF2254 domain-containing protein [Nocardioides flavus (ex Wang et al. 2016)]GHE18349.1 hypothetical protein GCM10011376_29590 [Nocardioides flavus (ex Wang et al. 2016)]